MKLYTDIPFERYDDTRYCHDYLNSHKTIGDEEAQYTGEFHLHWRGPIDNDKILLQIKSTLATQEVKKIHFWIENQIVTLMSPNYGKFNQFRDFIEVKVFDRDVLNQAIGEQKNKDKIWQYFASHHADYRYKTDILRWIVLNIFGGIYTDADTFLLRDLREIKINNWSSKWGREPFAEACILKLQKGHNAYEQMYLNNPTNPQCFLYIVNEKPMAFDYKYDNLNFTSLPSAFFDMAWNEFENNELEFLSINNFTHFFEKTDKDFTMDNFFKGCFSYHWHNFWKMPEYKDSPAGRLNKHLDKIIEEKYGIKPHKIFQQE